MIAHKGLDASQRAKTDVPPLAKLADKVTVVQRLLAKLPFAHAPHGTERLDVGEQRVHG